MGEGEGEEQAGRQVALMALLGGDTRTAAAIECRHHKADPIEKQAPHTPQQLPQPPLDGRPIAITPHPQPLI